MADRLWRAQVTIPLASEIPEDAIVNTFHFDDDDDPAAAPEDTAGWIMEMLTAFYNVVDGELFGDSVGPEATVKMYDMATPEPRLLIATDTIALTPSVVSCLPNEVALCLSYAAAPAAGVNPQRRRGRVFLGPVKTTAVATINGQSRPIESVRTAIAAAAGVMCDGIEHPASPGFRCRWALYSPTTDEGGATVGDSFFDVVSGWIDDAWDTQRRRGAAPTARVTFAPSP